MNDTRVKIKDLTKFHVDAISFYRTLALKKGRSLHKDYDLALSKGREITARSKKLRSKPEWVKTAGLSGLWRFGAKRIWARELPLLQDLSRHQQELVGNTRREIKKIHKYWLHLDDVRSQLQLGYKRYSRLRCPQVSAESLDALVLRSQAWKRSKGRAQLDLIHSTRQLIELLASATETPAKLTQKPVVNPPYMPPPRHAPEDVFLPIPINLAWALKGTEARRASGSKFYNQLYLPIGTPLAEYDRFLPMKYKKKMPDIRFLPNTPENAKKLNIRNLFDKSTWDHVRFINRSKSGGRCVLCGNISSYLVETSKDPETRGGTVECHEVWDWKRHPVNDNIGIQSLLGLMTVCYACHMTFHSDVWLSRIKHTGRLDELRDAMRVQREEVSRRSNEDIQADMHKELQRIRGLNDIEHWIVDLEHLSRQDYSDQLSPIFNEGNTLGFEPGMVAGLAFETTSGEMHDAITVSEAIANTPSSMEIRH